jgi:hypothetical protein
MMLVMTHANRQAEVADRSVLSTRCIDMENVLYIDRADKGYMTGRQLENGQRFRLCILNTYYYDDNDFLRIVEFYQNTP